MRSRQGTSPKVLLQLGLLLLVLLLPAPALAEHTGPLAGQWHLDEVASTGSGDSTPDSSGHGLAAFAPQGTLRIAPGGRFANYLSEANTQIADAGSSVLLRPQTMTVIAWVRRSGSPGTLRYIATQGHSGNDCSTGPSYAIYTGVSGGLSFFVRRNSGFTFSPDAGTGIWDGRWHMVAGTYDGGRVRLFVDGAEVGSGTVSPGDPINYSLPGDRFSIDGYPVAACGTSDFTGGIDEVRVYRRALSATEIGRLAAAPGPDPPTLVPDSPVSGTAPPAAGAPPTPTAAFDPIPASANERGLVRLSAARASFAGLAKNAKFLWDFGGNGSVDAACNGTQSSVQARIVGRMPNVVKLTVVDQFRQVATTAIPLVLPVNPLRIRLPTTIRKASSAARRLRFAKELPDLSLFKCGREAKDPIEDLTGGGGPGPRCGQTIYYGLIDVRGCLERVTGLHQVPQGDWPGSNLEFWFGRKMKGTQFRVRSANARAAQFGGFFDAIGEAQRRAQEATEAAFAAQDLHITREPVRVNGLDFIPANGATILFWPQRELLFSRNATVKLGAITLHEGYTSFDVGARESARTVPIGSFDPLGRLSKIGGFDVSGRVDVVFEKFASRVGLDLRLPNVFTLGRGEPVTGDMTARVGNDFGLRVDNAGLHVPLAYIGPVEVRDLRARYRSQNEQWKGTFFVSLYPGGPTLNARPPPEDNGVLFERGAFRAAGADLTLPGDGVPVFTDVFLKRIDFRMGLKPTRFDGGVGLNALRVVRINGRLFAVFPSGGERYVFPRGSGLGTLDPLEGREFRSTAIAAGGSASISVPVLGEVPLASAYAVYVHPSLFEFGGHARITDDPRDPLYLIEGGVNGAMNFATRRFNLEGRTRACAYPPWPLPDICIGGEGLVSSKGAAACVEYGIRLGVGIEWGHFPDFYIFGGCSVGPYRAQVSKAQAGGRAFTVPRGSPSVSIRVGGAGGSPRVALVSPQGQRISAPANAVLTQDGRFGFLPMKRGNTTFVGIKDPAPGRWTVVPEQGSPAISGLASSLGQRPARIRVKVTGSGLRRRLRYRIPRQPGLSVSFEERGHDVSRVIARSRRSSGSVRFRPGGDLGGRHRIVAVLERQGLPMEMKTVGSFRAPRLGRPARPHRVKAHRRGRGVRVGWSRARGASRYMVVLRLRGGARRAATVSGRRRSTTIRRVPRYLGGRVLVRGLSRRGVAGRPATTRLRASGRARTRFRAPIKRRLLRRPAGRRR